MAAGRGAGPVRPDVHPGAAHLRTNTSTNMDEEADDRVTYKDADGADPLPDVAAHARTDDHTKALN